MEDFLKTCLLIISVVTCLLGILVLAFTCGRALDRNRLKDMKENNTSVIINGEHLVIADISELSVNSGTIEIKMKDGKEIYSGNFTIVTPPQDTIEK